ncbi:MAG: RibD family protein [Gammaproteobacteria bacterium]|nr:RibD family protein [Gammaproteobacteria bacterium]
MSPHGAAPLSVRRPLSGDDVADAAVSVSDDVRRAWDALLALRAGRLAPGDGDQDLGLDAAGRLIPLPPGSADALLSRRGGTIGTADAASEAARALLDLYLPIAAASAERPLTVAHLGQSLDGYIATDSGDSFYVTGPDNVLHLHRMRALSGAVIVGAETVSMDDPRLTARRAAGPNPLRVVLDPRRRLAAHYRVFSDREAPTLLICAEDRVDEAGPAHGRAEVVGIPAPAGRLALDALLALLHARGIRAVFVEGGGATVSHFLQAGLLDRLQIAVAPIVTGHGRPGIRLVARHHISECLRPAHRVFRMGGDVLFDCDLGREAEAPEPADGADASLSRIL